MSGSFSLKSGSNHTPQFSGITALIVLCKSARHAPLLSSYSVCHKY